MSPYSHTMCVGTLGCGTYPRSTCYLLASMSLGLSKTNYTCPSHLGPKGKNANIFIFVKESKKTQRLLVIQVREGS